MSTPAPKPRRRNSFIGQWDNTTNVVNVRSRYYSTATDRYTSSQKATFTRWLNIQLRALPLDMSNFPEIKAIDKDFRDGKLLIQLLHVLYPEDTDLPKSERGNTRHHHIANVNKVLTYVRGKLDASGLAALDAIGPVDIVDGNAKLTMGLIWLVISKFHHLSSVFEVDQVVIEESDNEHGREESDEVWYSSGESESISEIVEEDVNVGESIEVSEVGATGVNEEKQDASVDKEISREGKCENDPTKVKDKDKSTEADEKQSQGIGGNLEKLPESTGKGGEKITSDIDEAYISTDTEQMESSSAHKVRQFVTEPEDYSSSWGSSTLHLPLNRSRRPLLPSQYVSKRMSMPANAFETLNKKPTRSASGRFRTLHVRSNSTPVHSSSGLLFWLNVQLIDLEAQLPGELYPVKNFESLNDGILLTALVHHLNKFWLDDFESLIKEEGVDEDGGEEKEESKKRKIKKRLSECFTVLEQKLNIKQPTKLIELLVKSDENTDKSGIEWSMYVSEVFMAVTKRQKILKERRATLLAQQQLLQQQETIVEPGEATRIESPDQPVTEGSISHSNVETQRPQYPSQPVSIVDKPLPPPPISYAPTANTQPRPPEYQPHMQTSKLAYDTREVSSRSIPNFDKPTVSSPRSYPRRRPSSPQPAWTPSSSIVAAIWEWTSNWLANEFEDQQMYDFDDIDEYDRSGARELGPEDIAHYGYEEDIPLQLLLTNIDHSSIYWTRRS